MNSLLKHYDRSVDIFLPAFIHYPSLPFLLHTLSLYLLSTSRLYRTGVSSNCHGNNLGRPRSQTPSLIKLIPKWHRSGHHPIYLRNSIWSQLQGQQQRERQWKRAHRRRPTPLETEVKRQRRMHTHRCPQCTRAHLFPAKICQPIKLGLAGYRRAPFRPASRGYIKRAPLC